MSCTAELVFDISEQAKEVRTSSKFFLILNCHHLWSVSCSLNIFVTDPLTGAIRIHSVQITGYVNRAESLRTLGQIFVSRLLGNVRKVANLNVKSSP